MKEQNHIKTLVNSKYYSLLLLFVSFFFVVLFSRSTSFLYVFEGGDPAIFKQMGLALLRGKTLYVDYFDNKGCILYFIQALGLWMGGNFFILLMQAFSLTITLMIWDKMLALYRDERGRLMSLGIALVLLLCFYQDGDLTEEWCLPFASYPLLVYFRALKANKEIRSYHWLIIGFCFGVIAFIRINNAVPFLGFVIYSFIIYLIRKDFKRILINATCFLSGVIIIACACILYFYLKAGWHGIDEMFYATFLSNFEYLSMKGKHRVFLCIFYCLFLFLCFMQQILNSRNNKEILIPAIISYLLFVITFGTRCFTHYLMALLPLLVILLLTTDFQNNKKRNLCFIVSATIAVFFYLPVPIAFAINDMILKNDKYSVIYNDFHHCIESVPKTERDSIYNYNLAGTGSGFLQHENILQCNKVLFSTFAFKYKRLNDEEKEKFFYPPKWILISWNKKFFKRDAYIILNYYDLYCDFPHDRIYLKKPQIGKTFQVYLYRRKDNFFDLIKDKNRKQAIQSIPIKP